MSTAKIAASPQPEVGEVYVLISSIPNPFEQSYAKVLALRAGYIQFKTGKLKDYFPGKSARSTTLGNFMAKFGPL